MTWFRVGGAGIPATLKNAMNAVFNKKFGTSGQNYPPKQWPDDVNLLGPLPIKTASGSIASFFDGADTVPVKSCTVAFGPGGGGGTPADPVPLVGYSGLTLNHLGANVLDLSTATPWYASYGLTASVSGDTVTISGTYNSTIVNPTFRILQNVPNNGCLLKAYDISGISQIDVSWQTGENQLVVKFYGMSQNQQYEITFKPLGYFGATAPATYSSYSKTTISDSFGQTLYGGERDLVTDGMKRTWKTKTVSELTWTAAQIGTSGIYRIITSSLANEIKKPASNSSVADILASIYTALTANATYSQNIGISVNTQGNIYIYDSNYNQSTSANAFVADFGAQKIAYALDTAENITGLTAHDIETNYADNNFYADIPDSTMTVKYRADIALALQAVSSSRGLMMASRPVTQLIGEESDPDQVNELVENDETEQEGEDNAR